MRLLANENVAGAIVHALRAAGFDVLWARNDMPGASDDEILARAVADSRVLITFDRDFGELAFRRRLPASCGIDLRLFSAASPELVAERTVEVIQSREDWSGHFATIEETRIRFRPLPAPDPSAEPDE